MLTPPVLSPEKGLFVTAGVVDDEVVVGVSGVVVLVVGSDGGSGGLRVEDEAIPNSDDL